MHGASWQFQKFDCLSTRLYTLHSTLNNLHSRLYAPTSQHHNAPTRQDSTSTLYISHSTLNTLHTQHSTHSLLHNSPYISTPQTPNSTLHGSRSYNTHWNSPHFTLHTSRQQLAAQRRCPCFFHQARPFSRRCFSKLVVGVLLEFR